MVYKTLFDLTCFFPRKSGNASFEEAHIRKSAWKAPGLEHTHHAREGTPPVRVKRMAQRVNPDLLELGDGLHDGIAFFDGIHSFPPSLDTGRFTADQDFKPDPSDTGRLDMKAARLTANAGVGPIPSHDAGQSAVSSGLFIHRIFEENVPLELYAHMDESVKGHRHGRQSALHVGCAPAVKSGAVDRTFPGRMNPGVRRPGGNHIHMTIEEERSSTAGPLVDTDDVGSILVVSPRGQIGRVFFELLHIGFPRVNLQPHFVELL